MSEAAKSWAKTAALPALVLPVVFLIDPSGGCGQEARVLSTALGSSQVFVVLGMLMSVSAAAERGSARVRSSRTNAGRSPMARERQHSAAMDDWDAHDRPSQHAGDPEPEDGEVNIGGRLAVLLLGGAAILFALVLVFQQFSAWGCVSGFV